MPSSKETISRELRGKDGNTEGFPQVKFIFLQLETFQSFREEIKETQKTDAKKYLSPPPRNKE